MLDSTRDIDPGMDYPTAIVEAINAAAVLVLILTTHAAVSPHILSEVGHAFNGKKRIIPVRLSNEPLPENLEYFLSMTQWLDASDGCTGRYYKKYYLDSPNATAVARGGSGGAMQQTFAFRSDLNRRTTQQMAPSAFVLQLIILECVTCALDLSGKSFPA